MPDIATETGPAPLDRAGEHDHHNGRLSRALPRQGGGAMSRPGERAALLRTLAPIALAIAAGIALRLAYPGDIEWKLDERFTFDHARALAGGGAWEWLGMPTSLGPPNPGLSLWAFAALAGLFGAESPPALARVVQSFNGAALVAFAAFAWKAVPAQRREAWLWGAALWAVNPLAVLFERKIWPPSLLPLFAVAFIAAWWYRRARGAAFLWGVCGALMAQLHLGVAFLAVALAAWTFVYDRAAFAWKAWIAGSVVGVLPALPWLIEIVSRPGQAALRLRMPFPTYFVRWVTQPFGLGLDYALGWHQFAEYLAGPPLLGYPTYLMGSVHIVLIGILVFALIRAARDTAARRPPVRALLLGQEEPEAVLVNAALWGYGIFLTLLTAIGAGSHRHYLIVIAPVMALWCARLILGAEPARRARALIAALCLAQAVATAGVLNYIHRTQIIRGEYGPTWQWQQSNHPLDYWRLLH